MGLATVPRKRAGRGVAVNPELIRQTRLRRGLSLERLGGAEITRAFLSQVERGEALPSLRTLVLIADRLGQPIDYFKAAEQESSLEEWHPTEGLADDYVKLARHTEVLARTPGLTTRQIETLQALALRLRRYAVLILSVFEPDSISVAGGAGRPAPPSAGDG